MIFLRTPINFPHFSQRLSRCDENVDFFFFFSEARLKISTSSNLRNARFFFFFCRNFTSALYCSEMSDVPTPPRITRRSAATRGEIQDERFFRNSCSRKTITHRVHGKKTCGFLFSKRHFSKEFTRETHRIIAMISQWKCGNLIYLSSPASSGSRVSSHMSYATYIFFSCFHSRFTKPFYERRNRDILETLSRVGVALENR